MRFGILGPLEVWAGERRVNVGGPQQRALLAVLLLEANRVVSAERLVDELWGGQPPASARSLLHGCVAQLRRALRTELDGVVRQPLVTRAPGYVLEVAPGELDADRFEELERAADGLIADGSAAALERAAGLLREALDLYRGQALEDLAVDVCRVTATRLEERRLTALERRIDLELRLGRHARLVAELQALVRAQPLRERLWAQLMVALSGAGRQADALAAYRELRSMLVEQLGVEPSAMLQELERAALSGADCDAAYHRERGMATEPATRSGTTGYRPAPADAVPVAGRVVPAQLPATVSAFTGRNEQLLRLNALVAEGGGSAAGVVIVAVAGSAGVGKTALAVQWAHRMRERYTDGQLYVDLRGYTPGRPMQPVEALAGFLRALGLPAEQVPVDVGEAAALYRTLLAGRRILVVLDNARTVEQVRPLLPGEPGCVVVVTSRDRLGGLVAREGARQLTLGALPPQEAHELLVRLLGRERVAAERRAAEDLARLCGCLPLALRVAAAHLEVGPERGIGEYVAELAAGDRLAALEIDGDEQAAVRAAFDLSYATLPAPARQLFRRLGLMPGTDVSTDAAAVLAGTAPRDAGRLLSRLADGHLLTQSAPSRFSMHDLLRLYAAERAHAEEPAEECAAAVRRLLDWCVHTTDAAATRLYPSILRLPVPPSDAVAKRFGDHTEALAWLDAERANLLSAIQIAAEHGPRPAAWLLADALRGYFVLRMDAVEWLAAAHAGLAAAEVDGDARGQAAANLSIADANLFQSRYPQAAEHYARALVLMRQAGWPEGQAAVLGNLGIVDRELGALQQAAEHHMQALALNRLTGRLAGQANNLGNLGVVLAELGRLAQATDHHAQALAVFRELGASGGEAAALGNLGEVLYQRGRLNEALNHLSQALTLHREVGDRATEAHTLARLAAVHCAAGRHALALELGHDALGLAEDIGERRFEIEALNTLATVYQRLDDHERALGRHQRALRLARDTGLRYPEAETLVGLAAVHRSLARHDQARVLAEQALTLARRAGFSLTEGHALTTLATIHLGTGELDRAAAHARQALKLHRRTGHRLGEARTLLVLGHALRRRRRVAAARWQQAHALFIEAGAPEADEARALLRQDDVGARVSVETAGARYLQGGSGRESLI